MAKQAFVVDRLRGAKLEMIRQANGVIDEYQAAGYRMTLRQLYYQFVSRNWLTNSEKSYKALAAAVSDGRLTGHIDWDAIEDRGRVADSPRTYDDPQAMVDLFKRAAEGYARDLWEGQNTYVELWVEKQALAGVLEPVAREYRVTLMVNKGYSSQSAMFESAQRIRHGMMTTGDPAVIDDERAAEIGVHGRAPGYVDYNDVQADREGCVLYLGDHDPSGEDMVRDVQERLVMLGVDGNMFGVTKVALTMEQIQKYKPPPNPAKLTDSRAAEYVAKHGTSSWEVDALPPDVLVALIRSALDSQVSKLTKQSVLEREAHERKALLGALDNVTL